MIVLLALTAWGIYQPPVQVLSDATVELGLEKLAASSQGSWLTSYELGGGSVVHLPSSEDAAGGRSPGTESDGSAQIAKVSLPTAPLSLGGRGDFELLGSDGVRLGCDRTVLEVRWPWSQQRLAEWSAQARDKARGRANWMASAALCLRRRCVTEVSSRARRPRWSGIAGMRRCRCCALNPDLKSALHNTIVSDTSGSTAPADLAESLPDQDLDPYLRLCGSASFSRSSYRTGANALLCAPDHFLSEP